MENPVKKPVTISDVAHNAGVDKATVSRVLNGDPRISEKTRERVWRAVQQLGYRKNLAALALSRRSSGMVGVVFDRLSCWWTGPFLEGLNRVFLSGGKECLIRSTDRNERKTRFLLAGFVTRQVEGLLWAADSPFEGVGDLPFVSIGSSGSKGGMRLQLDEDPLLESALEIAKGRPLVYRSGPFPLFPFFSRFGKKEEKDLPSNAVVLFDDCLPPMGWPSDRGVVCGNPEWAKIGGFSCFEWPAFDLGVLSARLLLDALKGKIPATSFSVRIRVKVLSREDF